MDKDQKIIELESDNRAFKDALKHCAYILDEEGYHALSSQIREILRLRGSHEGN